MSRRVLVTGAAGYIGAETCRSLTAAGFEPWGLDIRQGFDVRNRELVVDAVRQIAPLGVIHLAAHSDAAESMRAPAKYLENVAMSAAVASIGLPLVLASSAAVYGEGGVLPLAETTRAAPVNPYGQSKVASEGLLPGAMRLRYFNVAGGCDPNRQHLAPQILEAATGGRPLLIHGEGGCVRDFVDVRDVALANVLALQALLAGAAGEAINICSGDGASILDVVDACETVLGRPIRKLQGPPRPGDPQRLVGSNRRASEVLDWAPRYRLPSILASAIAALEAA